MRHFGIRGSYFCGTFLFYHFWAIVHWDIEAYLIGTLPNAGMEPYHIVIVIRTLVY